uniref:Uncharacterized protein n=1 Tax=Manihot esculenta TaxID=3983 RepID=A0A2C9V8Z1_MANES
MDIIDLTENYTLQFTPTKIFSRQRTIIRAAVYSSSPMTTA